MAYETLSVNADITAQNTFTDWLNIGVASTPGQRNFFTVSVAGTFVATVTVQYRRGVDQSNVIDDTGDGVFTAPDVKVGELVGRWDVRAGVKTGDFTSGTAELYVARA